MSTASTAPIPRKDPKAKRFDRLTHSQAIEGGYKVMDATAFALARETSLPIIVFSIAEAALKEELSGLRTGRASAHLLDPVMVEAYGAQMPLVQCASITVPEPRMISVNVWDRSLVKPVEKAIVDSNLGLSPATEGQTIRLRIPELNQDRRKELVKLAHKYAESARVAVRHVRRDAMDVIKKLEKDHKISKDDHDRFTADIQKATDSGIGEIDQMLASKEKEILTV
jgi:ribosome recycling factor